MGIESSIAVAMPVTMLVAPGPEVAMATPTRARCARIAVGHVDRALLVPDEDVADGKFAQRIVRGQNRAAGVAEDLAHTLAFERRPDDFRAGETCALRSFLASLISCSLLLLLSCHCN